VGVDLGATGAERRQMEADQLDPRWLAWLSEMGER